MEEIFIAALPLVDTTVVNDFTFSAITTSPNIERSSTTALRWQTKHNGSGAMALVTGDGGGDNVEDGLNTVLPFAGVCLAVLTLLSFVADIC